MTNLPEAFVSRVSGAYGEKGIAWLQNLPKLLQTAENRWQLTDLHQFPNLAYNYVATARDATGKSVVFKAGVPGGEFLTEPAALRHFDGCGMVRLLKSDDELGLMLLEHLLPGANLAENIDEETATNAFIHVLNRLKKSPSTETVFPSVSDWAGGFKRLRDKFGTGANAMPARTLDRAEDLMTELISSSGPAYLLHGDLHHWNILSAQREPWLAIDPKGVLGELEYEVGAWLRNPFPQLLQSVHPERLISNRVDMLAERLRFDRERLLGWGYCQSVLAGVWSYVEGLDEWRNWIHCAGIFKTLFSGL